MTLTRRRMLLGATTLMTTALSGRWLWGPSAAARPPGVELAAGLDAIVVHDGGTAGVALARKMRTLARRAGYADTAVSLLTLPGITRVRGLLEDSRGRAFVSLLDDAETLVMERLLAASGAAGLSYCRYGRQVLLTARL